MKSAISWFEIPTLNLPRAQAFYEAMLDCKLRPEAMGPSQGAIFPYEGEGVGGALLCGPDAPTPGHSGVLIYLDASPSLDAAVQRARAAGAEVLVDRLELPEGLGYIAHLIDLDGNCIGLHALT
ncbi:VOC family protein [Roseateles sp. BYS180W]|uniref:VOC family protein n=1 Tax=Roseateles rivi TaxID=3299028 RepID=A0ABW7FT74_9BURK